MKYSSDAQLIELVIQLIEKGQLDQALNILISLNDQHKKDSEVMRLLGTVHAMQGNFVLALKKFNKAEKLHPQDPVIKNNLGTALYQLKRFDEALISYGRAIQLQSNYAQAYANRASAFKKLGRLQEALQDCSSAIQLEPNNPEFHKDRGMINFDLSNYNQAIDDFVIAIQFNPAYAEAYDGRGQCYLKLNDLDAAKNDFDHAVNLAPNFIGVQINLAITLAKLGEIEKASALFKKIIKSNPTNIDALMNQAIFYANQMQMESAYEVWQKVLQIDPQHIEANWSLALIYLSLGNFKKGWQEYEYRWKRKIINAQIPDIQNIQPLENLINIATKKILIWNEQGFGDTIQFSRYIPLLKNLGADIYFLVRPELFYLFKEDGRFGEVLKELNNFKEFDFHCPLLSLPKLFETDLASIPVSLSYLTASKEKSNHWKNKLALINSNNLHVGLVWCGGSKLSNAEDFEVFARRDMAFKYIALLKNIPSINFYSLQKGNSAEADFLKMKDQYWPENNLFNVVSELNDFSDTAALIENLDLVISVDTAVAHLAAALGKPVWLLNRFDSEWRWLGHRKDSPWYPTLKIYNQPKPGDWDSVMRAICVDVSELTRHH